ncbi:fumarate hydratase [Pseudomonas aeruginosa]|nr:fumarate hydratase [Pseudomonas aeruginosa]
MAVIKQDDLIQSVADALQFISYYHPVDFIQAMHEAYLREESPAARDSMAQILINSRMCATGHRPICQDTGIVTVFVRVGMDVRWDGATMSVDDMINEGVRRAYNLPENVLRASILADPAGARKNTKDNTPAVIHYSIVPGDKVEVDVAAKGGGSENKSKMAMLNPSDSIVDWVLKTVPTMGAGWCPPGMLGIGIGGTAEKAAVMAKEVLMDPIDIHELKARGPQNRIEGTAPGAVREGQPAGHRCPGSGRPDHRARRQDHGLPDPRRLAAGVHDPQLRRDPPRPLRARRLRPRRTGSAVARRLPGDRLGSRPVRAPRRPGQDHPGRGAKLETGRDPAAQRQDAHRPRRRAQAHGRHAEQGRNAAGGPERPLHLLRRPGRSGRRRGGRPGRSHHRHPDGQVHPPDPRTDRPAGHDRQVRARSHRHRGDQGQQGGNI